MLLLSLIIGCTSRGLEETGVSEAQSCPEAPPPMLELPADDALHEEDVEWWYWTGHLTDETGAEYGFEQVVFVFQMGTTYRATSAHLALTQIDAQEHRFVIDYLHGEVPDTLVDSFLFETDAASAVGGDGSDRLQASFEGISWDLALEAQGIPMLQHGDGYHDYDVGGYTWYYTRPRMTVGGSLVVDEQSHTVEGEAWFDHQYGALGNVSMAGWDWFALQLNDGREVMIFLSASGDVLHGGSIREGNCVTEIDAETLSVAEYDPWTSEVTGCSYPQRWEIDVEGEHFVIESVLEDQEMPNSYNDYWEGAARVSGDQAGSAYVELAGQCD